MNKTQYQNPFVYLSRSPHYVEHVETDFPQIKNYRGKKIKGIFYDYWQITITFEDKNILIIDLEREPVCCEEIFIDTDNTDDEIKELSGSILKDIEIRESAINDSEWSAHDVQFLEISTDKGFLTFKTHVIHNGYYGGFNCSFTETKEEEE